MIFFEGFFLTFFPYFSRFYMINYLEMGESWKQDRRARDNEDKPFEDEDLPSGFDSDKSDSEVRINLTFSNS